MWILLSAIATASVLGSLHCVGMCGPLAIWAAGADQRRSSGVWFSAGLYHLGRGVTYAIAGFIAGGLGQLVDLGGDIVGVQLLAARVVGSLMILFGLVAIFRLIKPYLLKRFSTKNKTVPKDAPASSSTGYVAPKPNWITAQLLKLRPTLFKLPLPLRGLTVGLLTALLPCGWLYLFALVAAGTGSLWIGSLVMIAFWAGTVPLLVGLVAGTRLLSGKVGRAVPFVASLLLVVAGAYTASGRGFANLSHELKVSSVLLDQLKSGDMASMNSETIQQGLRQIVETPLPCCPHCLNAQQPQQETVNRDEQNLQDQSSEDQP